MQNYCPELRNFFRTAQFFVELHDELESPHTRSHRPLSAKYSTNNQEHVT